MAAVVRANVQEIVTARGRVGAKQEASLLFPLGGTLKAVHVEAGQRIEAGDLLAELDAPDAERAVLDAQYSLEEAERGLAVAQLQLQLAQDNSSVLAAQATFDRAELELQYAEVEFDKAINRPWDRPEVTESYSKTLRLREWDYRVAEARLADTRQSAQLNLAVQRLQLESAQARLERARLQSDLAQKTYSSTLLSAPFTGIVISLDRKPGDRVTAYERIGSIADPSELLVVATVLEQDVDRIAPGQNASIQLDVYPDREFTGKVVQIAGEPVVWQGQNAYEVTIAFDTGQDVPATIHMGADVGIGGRSRVDVLVVPNQAILVIGGQPFVEVVRPGGTVDRVEVEIGITDGMLTEIADGLHEGDQVLLP